MKSIAFVCVCLAMLSGCAVSATTSPSSEPEQTGSSSSADHASVERNAAALDPLHVAEEDVTEIDPTGKPDQLWKAHVLCDKGAPDLCDCYMTNGNPVWNTYIVQNTCQCEAFANRPGKLIAVAACPR